MQGTFYCSDVIIVILILSRYAGKVLLFWYYYCSSFPCWYCQDMPGTFYCSDVIIVLHFHADIVKICREGFTVPILLLSFISILILSRYAGKVLLFRYYYCPSFPFWYCQDMPGRFYCSYIIIVLHFHFDIVKICREGFTVPILLLSFVSILILSRYAGNILLFWYYYCPSFPFWYCQNNNAEAFYCLILLSFISCWYRQDMPGRFYCSDVIILLSFISMLISSRYARKVLLSFISILILSR